MRTADHDILLPHICVVQQNPNSTEGHASFEIIRKACLPTVVSAIAQVRLHGPDMEDTVQETFLALWESLPKYKPEKSQITTLVYRIAYNRAISLIRGNRSRSRRDGAYEILLRINPIEHKSGLQNENRDEHYLLQSFIDKHCDDIMKEIIHFVTAGFSFSEIAKKMDMKIPTAKTRWRRFCIKFNEYYRARITRNT
jgi:RNA polymerase sigma factor (sigma-70 family)